MTRERLVVAMTGASGAPYALNFLGHLRRLSIPFDFLVSASAVKVLQSEVDADRVWLRDGLADLDAFGIDGADVKLYGGRDFMAPCASGTALRAGMVILPCSMGTLGRIVAGISQTLIERAADVCLKERRRLVLVPREAPLSRIHLENMLRATDAGAVVLPAAPGFYHGASTVEHLLDHVSAKILDAVDIEHDVIRRWGS